MRIGVDIGGTNVRAGLIHDGNIERLAVYPNDTKTAKSVMISVANTIKEVWHRDVEAIGVGCPGPLDYRNGIVINPMNLPFYHFDLKSELEKEFRRPVFIDNDAKCFTLAQYAQYPVSVLAGVTIGTGLGCGIVIDGVLFHGTRFAQEFSKIPWSSPLIATKMAEDIISKKGLVTFAKSQGVVVKTPHDLFELASDSSAAQKVWVSWGYELGRVLTVLHQLYDPQVIVMGGQIAKAWRYFSPQMKAGIKDHSSLRMPKVVVSRMPDAGIIGASMLVR